MYSIQTNLFHIEKKYVLIPLYEIFQLCDDKLSWQLSQDNFVNMDNFGISYVDCIEFCRDKIEVR